MAGLESLVQEPLPQDWDFGVMSDGRVFFIDDRSRTTTWVHPIGEPVQDGLDMPDDLPPGWSQAITSEGIPYYVDHISRQTSFVHPITLEATATERNANETSPPQQSGHGSQSAVASDHLTPPALHPKQHGHQDNRSPHLGLQNVREPHGGKLMDAKRPHDHQGGIARPHSGYDGNGRPDTSVPYRGQGLRPSGPQDGMSRPDGARPLSHHDGTSRPEGMLPHRQMPVGPTHRSPSDSTRLEEMIPQRVPNGPLRSGDRQQPPPHSDNLRPDEGYHHHQYPAPAGSQHAPSNNYLPMPYGPPGSHGPQDRLPSNRVPTHPMPNYNGPLRPHHLDVSHSGPPEPRLSPQQQSSSPVSGQDLSPMGSQGSPSGPVLGRRETRNKEAPSPSSPTSPSSTKAPPSAKSKRPSRYRRGSGKHKVLDRTPSAKRSERSPVSMRGWLQKQDSTGLKSWKKRWFVLSDFCLFYYKGPDEQHTLGSILLPSYKINPCLSEDSINKKFAFKAQHANMRTYYFAADSQEDMKKWMNAMSLASILQRDPNMEKEFNRTDGDGMPSPPNVNKDGDAGFSTHRPTRNALSPASPYNGQPSPRSPRDAAHRGRPLSEHYPKPVSDRGRPLSDHYPEYPDALHRGETFPSHSPTNPRRTIPISSAPYGQSPNNGSYDSTTSGQARQRPEVPNVNPHSKYPDNIRGQHPDNGRGQRPEPQMPTRHAQNNPPQESHFPHQPLHTSGPQRAPPEARPQDTMKDLQNWRDRQQPPAAGPAQPIYENVPGDKSQSFDSSSPPPSRPPLPVAFIDRLAHDLAKQKTPNTAQNILEASQRSLARANEPLFFQYPEDQKGDVARRQEGGRDPHNRHQPGGARSNHPIQTVREDPSMPESQVVATAANFKDPNNSRYINGHRLSITAEDLLGKSHEELVLLLIELRRKQSSLETARNKVKGQLDILRQQEELYQQQQPSPDKAAQHRHQVHGLRRELDDLEKQLEVHKPMVNLVDNMVKMGSLYGGQNAMMASQYKKHVLKPDQYTPPKKMIEFSRQHQEATLSKKIKEDVKHLSKEEASLEEKQKRLIELDKELQQMSHSVSSLQEDKDMLEKALSEVNRQIDQSPQGDPRHVDSLYNQHRSLERELQRVRMQLAHDSQKLEEVAAENAKVEHEVMMLRSKVMSPLQRSLSTPALSSEKLRAKMRLEKEVDSVAHVMDGLSKQGQQLSAAMDTLRTSTQHLNEGGLPSTYNETDLDSMETKNIAVDEGANGDSQESPLDISEADENMKRFYGLIPKDKPRAQTVRDVKQKNERKRQNKRADSDPAEEEGTEVEGAEEPTRVHTVNTLPKPKAVNTKVSQLSAAERLLGRRPSSDLVYGPRPFSLNKTSKSTPSLITSVEMEAPKLTKVPAARRNSRGRYMTISSSHPVSLETPKVLKNVTNEIQRSKDDQDTPSRAKDDTDIIESNIDEWTIDRELLGPEKVLIPERYQPESDDEELTAEEKVERKEKAERIRKMLSAHSLQEFTRLELNVPESRIHEKVSEEKKRREMVLELRHNLAREVTLKSKDMAEASKNPDVKTTNALPYQPDAFVIQDVFL